MFKSFAIRTPLVGPPEPQVWWTYKSNNGGSPVVIRRKLGYVVTALNLLGKWEQTYKAEKAKHEMERHPDALANLSKRVGNAEAWADYSAQVLRNCIRFALARIEEGSDHEELRNQRLLAGRREVASWSESDQALAEKVIFGMRHAKTLSNDLGLSVNLAKEKIKALRNRLSVRPFSKPTGRRNKAFHEELHYYARVLDSYLLAKTAVSGSSRAEQAMASISTMLSKVIYVNKMKSNREAEDAEQQAALGILQACREYEPGKDRKFAALATFAGWKILRETQVRRASHCRPGITMIAGGKLAKTGQVDGGTDNEGRPDQFHPAEESKTDGVALDVRAAMLTLSEEDRELVKRALQEGDRINDLAEEKGLTPGQLRSRLAKIKEKLAGLLAAHAD